MEPKNKHSLKVAKQGVLMSVQKVKNVKKNKI
jgi:hypothetical protein